MIVKPEQEELYRALNYVSFSEAVEKHKIDGGYDTYIGAVLALVEELDIDDKSVKKLISPPLLEKLRLEAEEEGFMFRQETPMVSFE